MRKTMLGTVVAAGIALAAPSVAGATHTGGGCVHHHGTGHAHHQGNKSHRAHQAIPYCPPTDTPGHERRAAR
ncbi:MAG TPA: hypothetical protein VGV40_08350 [Solirubrobacteraceae bacterium]|nr:hypothetical protein [Solirubrobacteraceae bacterium]